MRKLCEGAREDSLGDLAIKHLASGGKRLRARLAFAASERLGVGIDVMPWAATCELLHNASLVHDDIQDEDRVRRGSPALWVSHGVAQAINVGDLMLSLPGVALEHLDCSDWVQLGMMKAISVRVQGAVRGQSRELCLGQSIGWEKWRQVVQGKTGELLALPVEGAVLLSGQTVDVAKVVGDVFRDIGVIYQMRDDFEDLFGERLDGSDRGGAVAVKRLGWVAVEHLRLRPNDQQWLLEVMGSPNRSREEKVTLLRGRFRESGAFQAIEARIEDIADSIARVPEMRENSELSELAESLIYHWGGTFLAPEVHTV